MAFELTYKYNSIVSTIIVQAFFVFSQSVTLNALYDLSIYNFCSLFANNISDSKHMLNGILIGTVIVIIIHDCSLI